MRSEGIDEIKEDVSDEHGEIDADVSADHHHAVSNALHQGTTWKGGGEF